MKYGILTYHNIPNIGAVLQAYALCTKLRALGVDCEIIDYRCENIIKREIAPPQYKNPVKKIGYTLFFKKKKEEKIRQCQSFVEKYYSSQTYTKDTIKDANLKYDGFISGSDMIWNLEINGGDFSYFLDFAGDEKKKFSYASSVGAQWHTDSLDKVQNLLRRYDFISVREADTKNVIEKQFWLQCDVVCDPTMLLSMAEWDRYTTPVKEKNYVLVYFPYRDILNAAKSYAKKTGKKLIIMGMNWPWKSKDYKQIYSPQQWLSYIKGADAVFTDSYHGLLFSLYFQRQVWTNNHGSRSMDLLKELDLTKRFIENDPKFMDEISYGECNQKIERMREKSSEYLLNALKEN